MAGRKSTAAMELAIGATIIAGIIILIIMLMAWGNTSSILARHYRVIVNMPNVGGLKEGAPVKMGGFQIGRVASIQIRPGGTDMELVLDIDENRLLPAGSTAKVSTAGLIGDAYLEIMPGQSAEMVKRSTTIADAQRLASVPSGDISEVLAKVNAFGDQITVLTNNLNDIVGDAQFRQNLKSLANNLDNVTYQTNLILQRGQSVIDNIDTASQNVAKLTDVLRESVVKVTGDVEKITDAALSIAEEVKTNLGDVKEVVDGAKKAMQGVNDIVAKAGDSMATVQETLTTAKDGVKTIVDSASDSMHKVNEAVATAKATVESAKTGVEQIVAKANDSMDKVNETLVVAKDGVGHIVNKATDSMDKVNDTVVKVNETVAEVKGKVLTVVDGANATMATIKTSAEKMPAIMDNVNAGVTDARNAVNNTIGNPALGQDLRQTIANVNQVTGLLAKRRDATDQLITNLAGLSGDLRGIATQVQGITGGIDPGLIPNTLGSLNMAIRSMTEVVDQIKKEPVLALSINKAADRIVKIKFDELAKNPAIRTSDQLLQEINRWVNEGMNRGYFRDPSYQYNTRPYMVEEPTRPVVVTPATEKRPYMIER